MRNKKDRENRPSINEFLSLDDSLLYTKMYFGSEWLIGDEFERARESKYSDIMHSTLYLNSKTSGKTNLFEEFLNKEFRKPANEIYGDKFLAEDLYPYIGMIDGPDRCYLGFAKAPILSGLICKCDPQNTEEVLKESTDFEDQESDQKAIEILRQILKKDKKLIEDTYEAKTKAGVIGSLMSQSYQNTINSYISKIRATRRLPELLGKKIDTEKFKELFQYDKLALIFALSAYDEIVAKVNATEKVPAGALYYLSDYIEALEKMIQKYPKYRTSITYQSYNKNRKNFETHTLNTTDMLALYRELVENIEYIPAVVESLRELPTRFNVPKEVTDAMTPKEYSDLLVELMERDARLKSVQLNWELLPTKEGEIERETGASVGETKSRLVDTDFETRSEAFNTYISSLNPVLRLQGKNNFDGYIAYVFGNKKVILEKPKKGTKGEYYSATYVMELDSFFEISKLSRPEIIEGLKNNTIFGCRRLYHWYDEKSEDPIARYRARMEEELKGSEYDKEAIDEIYSIIEEQSKKEHKDGYQRVRTKENQN